MKGLFHKSLIFHTFPSWPPTFGVWLSLFKKLDKRNKVHQLLLDVRKCCIHVFQGLKAISLSNIYIDIHIYKYTKEASLLCSFLFYLLMKVQEHLNEEPLQITSNAHKVNKMLEQSLLELQLQNFQVPNTSWWNHWEEKIKERNEDICILIFLAYLYS